ncbi:hypothetical protein [Pseudomonas chlororaphis]|uniref:hypothetical protein n=1 Tax=Pseudomonas chlororaphis TaxID=587753 RepID=UPI000F7724C7|nr:hypothetical protein [Pseudomonas chlororaphis]MBM0285019.1 hypothetical protein [Pseudomonas chlororaphis]TWR99117.1 hypothetical protein FJD36_03895 [Pseudomonas chlororaphis subsp. chlororaphis]WDG99713.1 hypothetical protein PUP54_09135 [Pseudomonas chlororaphis]WDH18719.1 hypothetical protein PUP70_11635 [Pseudomonas chlororaphis]WDH66540.1 hypothetical protein PUP71_07445 [Pseudomonas chlororaphis]
MSGPNPNPIGGILRTPVTANATHFSDEFKSILIITNPLTHRRTQTSAASSEVNVKSIYEQQQSTCSPASADGALARYITSINAALPAIAIWQLGAVEH